MSTYTRTSPKPVVSPAQLADLLDMSVDFIYTEIHSGNLEAIRIGRTFRISTSEASRYFKALKVTVPSEWEAGQ